MAPIFKLNDEQLICKRERINVFQPCESFYFYIKQFNFSVCCGAALC